MTVFVFKDYNIFKGVVLKINAKSAKVSIPSKGMYRAYEENTPFHKIAISGDNVVLVWEKWKGSNGRGGYRWEHLLYPEARLPAQTIPHQSYLWEDEPFKTSSMLIARYIELVEIKQGKRKPLF